MLTFPISNTTAPQAPRSLPPPKTSTKSAALNICIYIGIFTKMETEHRRKDLISILLHTYTIPLDPRTKKNHQMIAGTGMRCPYCNKPKKQFIRQGKANQEYTFKAYPYLRPKPHAPIDTPVHIKYLFYMGTRRKVDKLNLQAAADDLLVAASIIKDDNASIVKSHDGTRVLYDKQNPRTEIYIYTYEEAQDG